MMAYMAKYCYLQPILTDATKVIWIFDKTSTSAIEDYFTLLTSLKSRQAGFTTKRHKKLFSFERQKKKKKRYSASDIVEHACTYWCSMYCEW